MVNKIVRDGRNLYCARWGILLDGNLRKGIHNKILREPFYTKQATIREAEYERFISVPYRAGLQLVLSDSFLADTRKNTIPFGFVDSRTIDSVMQDFNVTRISELPDKPAVLYVAATSYSRTPICMSAPPALDCRAENRTLDQSAAQYFDLNTRASNSLDSEGIRTVGDLISRTRSQLHVIHGFGKVSLREITTKLKTHGLYLKEE